MVSPRCARWPSTRSGFSVGPSATNSCANGSRSDEDRFVRYNAAVALARRGDQAAEGTLREMLSTADLDKVIELTGATEKQNKIEAIELEALEALRAAVAAGKPDLAESLRPQISRPDQIGAGQRAKPGLELLQSLQTQALNYTVLRFGRGTGLATAVDNPMRAWQDCRRSDRGPRGRLP